MYHLKQTFVLLCLATSSIAAIQAPRRRVGLVTRDASPFNPLGTTISLRGGAGPLPVEGTAKFTTAVLGLQGIFQSMAPAKCNGVYGLEKSDGMTEWVSEANGYIVLGSAVAAFMMFFQESSWEEAIGIGLIACSPFTLKSILNETPKKLGASSGSQWLNLSIDGFVIFTVLSGANYSDTVAKVFAIWLIVTGSQCFIAPGSAAKAWKLQQGFSPGASIMLQTLGQNLVSLGVFIGLLALGIEPVKAFGYSWIPRALSLAPILPLAKAMKDSGMGMEKVFPWLVLALVTSVTLSM